MIKEGIQEVSRLANEAATVQSLTIGGRNYTNKAVIEQKDPLANRVQIITLSGLRDLVAARIESFKDEEFLIHVESHRLVSLKRRGSDSWGRRLEIAQAVNEEETRFKFGAFLDHESFIIGLQANFLPSTDLEYLLRIASNVTNEKVVTSDDNGVSQHVGLKAGAKLITSETIKAHVTLKPYRTFREADQPASEFVFRVQQNKEEAIPMLALIEADGGKWKIDAMQNVAFWLKDKGIPATLPIVF